MADTQKLVPRWLALCLIVCLVVFSIAVPVSLLIWAIDKAIDDVERSGDAHLQVAVAFHMYHDQHGHFPPAAVHGLDGTPLYSWRVLILPWIEEGELYKEFHLDEPWDSPHNIRLLPKMPLLYEPPGRKAQLLPPYHTVCHVFVGKRTAFEGPHGLNLQADFPDGMSRTILLVDAGKPSPWTKPEELPYSSDGPLPDLEGIFPDGFWACMVDGGRRWVKRETSEATIRALITRNLGDQPGPDWQD